MDAIHVKNDGDGVNIVKKKKDKKRKSGEISSGEEVVDEGVRKKMKTKVSSDVSEGVLEEVVGKSVDKSSRKEKKKMKDIMSEVDVSAQDGDERNVGIIGKGEIGDREDGRKKKKRKKKETLKDAECDDTISTPVNKSSRKEKKKKNKISKINASAQGGDKKEGKNKKDETGGREVKKKKKEKHKEVEFDDPVRNVVSVVNQTDHEVNEAVELVECKKQKKKEKHKNALCDAAASNAGSSAVQTDHEANEVVDLVEGKKQKKKKDSKNLGANPLEKEHLKDCHVSAISGKGDSGNRGYEQKEEAVGSKMNREANAVASDLEGIQLLKEKKKKKENSDDSGADKESRNMNHVGSTSGSEKRKNALNVERVANAVALKHDEGDGTAETYDNCRRNKKSRRVKFSEDVEVFPHTDISSKGKEMPKNCIKEKESVNDSSENNEKVDDGLIRGKRFSKEEDAIIQNAVLKYIEDHHLGEEGLNMVLNCKSFPKIKNCWKEIGLALPHRPYVAVYSRAHVLFERSDAPVWTPEEIELLKEFYKKHGPDWKTLAVELGKHRFHVKDAWRRYKFPNLKVGNWSQEEYQKLFNLVNMDLSMKAYTEKKSKHGMLRDNIAWSAISDDLTTRTNVICCKKWYEQLTSPMVVVGKWANVDDYKLLNALSDLDAACEQDVNWDDLLENRSGDLCRKRWNEMIRHIGENGLKQFNEQVEILSQRYCPDLLDAREEYDNRPAVD